MRPAFMGGTGGPAARSDWRSKVSGASGLLPFLFPDESSLGNGGLDSALHRAAGPRLLAKCRDPGARPTGGRGSSEGTGFAPAMSCTQRDRSGAAPPGTGRGGSWSEHVGILYSFESSRLIVRVFAST